VHHENDTQHDDVIATDYECPSTRRRGWNSEPEPGIAEPFLDFTANLGNVTLAEGLLCPTCEDDDYRRAALTGCYAGYRETEGGILNLILWNPVDNVPGTNPLTGEPATKDDPCLYNMEARGNRRTDGKVRVTVCSMVGEGSCRLVTLQFVPECPGVEPRINAAGVPISINGCSIFSTLQASMVFVLRLEEKIFQKIRRALRWLLIEECYQIYQ